MMDDSRKCIDIVKNVKINLLKISKTKDQFSERPI